MSQVAIKPRAPIRRFDVFAEYNRLQALQRGLDQAHAKGYGLWVAKVPSIAAAFDQGQRYVSIRDSIRHNWSLNPSPAQSGGYHRLGLCPYHRAGAR